MREINHQQLKAVISKCFSEKLPLFVWGTFGIGKSENLMQFCKENNLEFIDVRISQLEPSDLRGLPNLNGETTKWLPPNWLPKKGKGILFFDEINLSPPSIQNACYQLILDRKLGEYSLPPDWVIVSAGNRIEDKANVFELSSPLLNRFTHIGLKIPSIEEWTEWALKNEIDTRILSFLNFKPSRIFCFDSKNKDKAIPTPRSWAFCSKLIKGIDNLEDVELYASMSIGEATAIELVAFLKLNRKIDFEKLLNNPKSIKEITEIDLKYCILGGISEYFRQHKKSKTFEQICLLSKEMEAEFGVLLLRFTKGVDENFFKKECMISKAFKEISTKYAKYLL